MYGVFGGTPRYHALVDTSRAPAEEIVTLLMQPLVCPAKTVPVSLRETGMEERGNGQASKVWSRADRGDFAAD